MAVIDLIPKNKISVSDDSYLTPTQSRDSSPGGNSWILSCYQYANIVGYGENYIDVRVTGHYDRFISNTYESSYTVRLIFS